MSLATHLQLQNPPRQDADLPQDLVVNQDTEEGRLAFRHAIELTLDQAARLVVLTVMPPTLRHVFGAASPGAAAGIERDILHHHQSTMRSVPAELGMESRIAYGPAQRRILQACDSCRCDLLILPGPRREGLLGWMTKQSLLRVARASKVPVLLIAARAEDASRYRAGVARRTTSSQGRGSS